MNARHLALIFGIFAMMSSPTNVQADPGGGDRLVGASFASRAPVIAEHGMVATAHPLASQVAIDILKQGGSAVDAAIAANATLGLMEPTGNGIGGDLFAIIWDPKTQKLYGYNGSGRSPMGRSMEDLKEKLGDAPNIPAYGSLPVTVPGTVDAWFAMHEKFGKMRMRKVLEPAITYAEDGFPVTQLISYYWGLTMDRLEKGGLEGLEESQNALDTYRTNGEAPKEGDIFKNPDLANTLGMIAKKGRKAYYEGDIAQTIDAYMKRIGGDLRYEDFAAHKGEWVEPVGVNYRGYDVFELPPSTQGVAALQILQILEGYDLASMGAQSAEALHLMVEAKRLAFEDVAKYYADPTFADIPLEWLISDAYADERRALISPDKRMADVEAGIPDVLVEGDTTYLTVADKDGMMVSLIQSNYRGMGSGLVADGLGFMFQDRGQLFNLDETHANAYAPGKRPFHTIIPAFMMKDGKPLMSFGLMGGAMQPQGHAQIVVNMVDFGMNVQEAGDAARFNDDTGRIPGGAVSSTHGTLFIESGVPAIEQDKLRNLGHNVQAKPGIFGGYQAIWRDPDTGVYHGASEMRKDGQAIGY